jgi:hypothetical protein
LQPESITLSWRRSGVPLLPAAVVLFVIASGLSWPLAQAPAAPQAQTPVSPANVELQPLPAALALAGSWDEAPAYLRLFAPASARSFYRAYVSRQPLDDALRAIGAIPSLLHPPGAWTPQASAPADAFGRSGSYNRWTVARLYGGTPVRFARGPRGRNGRADESWTLLSPYPAVDVRRLEQGTLLLVLRVPPL